MKSGLKDGGQAGAESFLKVLANSATYGIFAEMNRQELTKPAMITVQGIDGPLKHRTKTREQLGGFCYPPIAALIPAAARLMLALLERCVTHEGGHYALVRYRFDDNHLNREGWTHPGIRGRRKAPPS